MARSLSKRISCIFAKQTRAACTHGVESILWSIRAWAQNGKYIRMEQLKGDYGKPEGQPTRSTPQAIIFEFGAVRG